jgi:hypothetical protein
MQETNKQWSVVCVQLHGGMHATSPADSLKSQGQATSCYSEARVGGPFAQLVFALHMHVHNPLQQQALQTYFFSTFKQWSVLAVHGLVMVRIRPHS